MEEILDDKNSSPISKDEQAILPIVIWSVLVLFGVILLVLHSPGGFAFTLMFSASFTGYNCRKFVIHKGKSKLNLVFFALSLIWFIYLVFAMNSNLPMSVNEKGIMVFVITAAVIFVINWLFIPSSSKTKKL